MGVVEGAPAIALAAVDKARGVPPHRTPVLRAVNLVVAQGEKASLVGPSGSGKSTLLALVAGLLHPDTGTVTIGGVSMTSLDDRGRARQRARQVGIALQQDNLVPFLTARENVELALGFGLRPPRGAARRRSRALLARFGVDHRRDHLPRHLSGGEAQRVALAVSMANEPMVLLADEVVGQLDATTAGQVIEEVLQGDFALLYVTHDRALADLADTRHRLHDLTVVPG